MYAYLTQMIPLLSVHLTDDMSDKIKAKVVERNWAWSLFFINLGDRHKTSVKC